MKKVCLFNYPAIGEFHGYHISTMEPTSYFEKSQYWNSTELIWWGWNGFSKRRNISTGAAGIDKLYRARDPAYMRLVEDFVGCYRDYDLIVMSTYNYIHPEILFHELKKPIKILGFIDDPYSTYMKGIPYLWAFDGAFYISPSYNERSMFGEALEKWGCTAHTWWPLVPFPFDKPDMSDRFYADRSVDLAYVGNPSTTKVDRLIRLKQHFGERLRVHGRWPFKGYAGLVRGLFGKPIYPYCVRALPGLERTRLYHSMKIGINLHVSDIPMETGNMRMYEVPAHGAMLLCDKGARNAHEQIFAPGTEAVYYDSTEDAIEKAEHYLVHAEERIAIARAGCERFWRDYEWETNMLNFLNWAVSIPHHNKRE